MDLTLSFSRAVGWGTHDVVVECLSTEDPALEPFLQSLASARLGAANDADASWELRQAVESPVAGTLDLSRLVELGWYQPVDVPTTLAFDRRVTDRYTEYCASLGVFYAGTFTCEHLGDHQIVEVHAYDVDTPDDAATKFDESAYPDDFATIISDCRELQQRDEPRYILSLVPRSTT
ncbi:MAG: hypothetical protein ACKO04_10920 [Actinomycetes bacterium]